MKLRFSCENCGSKYIVDSICSGKKGKCKKCSLLFIVPYSNSFKEQSQINENKIQSKKILPLVSGQNKKMKGIWLPQIIVILMLLWAYNQDNPYGYYILLRWVCCVVFIYLSIKALNVEKGKWVWLFAITAFLYNPIINIHLKRENWTIVNSITILIAMASISIFKELKSEERVDFTSFVMERTISDPSLNLLDALDQYIEKYDLLIRTHLDETKTESLMRSRLTILEEAQRQGTILEPEAESFLVKLRMWVQMCDTMPPELRKRMKYKEKHG
jgi:hypothetical protein